MKKYNYEINKIMEEREAKAAKIVFKDGKLITFEYTKRIENDKYILFICKTVEYVFYIDSIKYITFADTMKLLLQNMYYNTNI